MSNAACENYNLPVDLTDAEDFRRAFRNWPSEPAGKYMCDLSEYGESVASQAEDAVRGRDARIGELEEQVADLVDIIATRDQEIADLAAHVFELENRP